jgi:hypothetical protein
LEAERSVLVAELATLALQDLDFRKMIWHAI